MHNSKSFAAELFGENQNNLWLEPINTVVVIDAGHGGFDRNGRYTTDPKTGKFFDHKDKGLNLHGIDQNSVFYEGIFNRIVARKLAYCLAQLGIRTLKCYDDRADLSLTSRTNVCNSYHRQFDNDTLVVSLHANAGGGKGSEIFTSLGETKSDVLADFIANGIAPTLSRFGRPFRRGSATSADKDRNLAMVTNTLAPAILFEFDFFDTLEGAKQLDTVAYQNAMCEAKARSIYHYIISSK
jgi:N-acetylmuramoyl-L-alanine amidase